MTLHNRLQVNQSANAPSTPASTPAPASAGAHPAVRRKRRKAKKRKKAAAAPPTLSQAPQTVFPHLGSSPLARRQYVNDAVNHSLMNDLWNTYGWDRMRFLRRNPSTRWGRALHKEALSKAYLKCLGGISAEREAYLQFFDECLRCNTRLRLAKALVERRDWLSVNRLWLEGEHARQVAAQRSTRAIALPHPRNQLDVSLFSSDLCCTYDKLRTLLWSEVYRFVDHLKQELYRLAENGTLGAIEWVPDTPPNCRATYFSTVARCEASGTGGIQIARCSAVHNVSLLNAYTQPLGVRHRLLFSSPPLRVQRVLTVVPKTLRKQLSVVYGTRIRTLSVEREMERHTEQRRETKRVVFDPLLIWGDLVLCGWDKEERSTERNNNLFGQVPFLIR